MDCNTAPPTVSTVDPVIDPNAALMVLVPFATPVARRLALIVATEGVPEAQGTEPVRLCVLWSVKFQSH
jgi:hypothetical protein